MLCKLCRKGHLLILVYSITTFSPPPSMSELPWQLSPFSCLSIYQALPFLGGETTCISRVGLLFILTLDNPLTRCRQRLIGMVSVPRTTRLRQRALARIPGRFKVSVFPQYPLNPELPTGMALHNSILPTYFWVSLLSY